jgi:hypothetical protein
LGWQLELQPGEQLALPQVLQLVEQRVQAAQPEVLPVLALLALRQLVQLLGHQIRWK